MIARTGAAAPDARAWLPMVLPQPPDQTEALPLWLAEGMISLADLPVGRAVSVTAARPWGGGPPVVDLVEMVGPRDATGR
jgi:hypothetical protein